MSFSEERRFGEFAKCVKQTLLSTKLHQCHNPSSWVTTFTSHVQQSQDQHQATNQSNQPTDSTQPPLITCDAKGQTRHNQDLWSFSSPHQWPGGSHIKTEVRLVDVETNDSSTCFLSNQLYSIIINCHLLVARINLYQISS